jgi:hypothetical protein
MSASNGAPTENRVVKKPLIPKAKNTIEMQKVGKGVVILNFLKLLSSVPAAIKFGVKN